MTEPMREETDVKYRHVRNVRTFFKFEEDKSKNKMDMVF